MSEAVDEEILENLVQKLTPEQAEQYAHNLLFHGRSAIMRHADGSVRVLSPEELDPRLTEQQDAVYRRRLRERKREHGHQEEFR